MEKTDENPKSVSPSEILELGLELRLVQQRIYRHDLNYFPPCNMDPKLRERLEDDTRRYKRFSALVSDCVSFARRNGFGYYLADEGDPFKILTRLKANYEDSFNCSDRPSHQQNTKSLSLGNPVTPIFAFLGIATFNYYTKKNEP